MTQSVLYQLVAVAAVAVLASEALPSLDYEAKQTYCGQHITNTLSMFCKGRYLSMLDLVMKRAGDNNDSSNDGTNDGDDEDDDGTGDNNAADSDGIYTDQFGRRYVGLSDDAIRTMERQRLESAYGMQTLREQLHRSAELRRQRLATVAAARSAAAAAAMANGVVRPRRANEQLYVYRGIADECCLRPCTVRTLLSYCRTPPKY